MKSFLEKLLSREGVRERWLKIYDIIYEDRAFIFDKRPPNGNFDFHVIDAAHVTRLENALKAAAGLREALRKLSHFEGVEVYTGNGIEHLPIKTFCNNALAAFDKALGE